MCKLPIEHSSLLNTRNFWETEIVEFLTKVEEATIEVHDRNMPEKHVRMVPGQFIKAGRTSASDLVVTGDRKISRQHFSVECCDDCVIVRDLGSSNGLYAGGVKFKEFKVYSVDQIVAGTTTFTIRLQREASEA